ncbi:hypothetical protein NQ318_022582 [Aromia moschata]|uniref:Uncharacterized protein n=1 Tax=Aromia moschata TaxID=1265417 RepID=A0AAV8XVU7_9CUCU|nr:hypothetical protein NQ318_022582 [Aromia moschata]
MQIAPIWSIITISVVTVVLVNGFLDYEIIEGYIRENKINYAAIIGCFSIREQLKIIRHFMPKKQMSVLNMARIDLEESLKIKNSHVGVVLDGDCANVKFLLTKLFDPA